MQKKQVLVIENEAVIQEVMQHILEIAGYEIIFAENGLIALEKLETMTPHVILLDLKMPCMDGFAFLEEVERRGIRSRFPLLIVSAHPQNKTELTQQVEGFIAKPFHNSHILESIRAAIEQYAASQQEEQGVHH